MGFFFNEPNQEVVSRPPNTHTEYATYLLDRTSCAKKNGIPKEIENLVSGFNYKDMRIVRASALVYKDSNEPLSCHNAVAALDKIFCLIAQEVRINEQIALRNMCLTGEMNKDNLVLAKHTIELLKSKSDGGDSWGDLTIAGALHLKRAINMYLIGRPGLFLYLENDITRADIDYNRHMQYAKSMFASDLTKKIEAMATNDCEHSTDFIVNYRKKAWVEFSESKHVIITAAHGKTIDDVKDWVAGMKEYYTKLLDCIKKDANEHNNTTAITYNVDVRLPGLWK